MAPAADPFVVHIARLRRSPGSVWHEVRRGPMPLAGPLEVEGIDPGRGVVPFGAEAECDVTLRPFSGGIAAVGTVRAPWEGICRRCTVPVAGELRIAVEERFAEGAGPAAAHPAAHPGATRPPAHAADQALDDLYPIVDDTIDLGPMVRDAIVLELPMAPLCREDCRGLCPQCGADRNEGECGCVAPADPRWANLDVLR